MSTPSDSGIPIWDTSDPPLIPVFSGALATALDLLFAELQSQFFVWTDSGEQAAEAGMSPNARGYRSDLDIVYRYNGTNWVAWEKPWATWVCTFTGLNVGSTGTVTARYCITGGTVHYSITGVFGGTGITSGNATFNAPVNRTAAGLLAEFTKVGSGTANTGATNPFPLEVNAVSAGVFRLRYLDDFTAGVAAPVLTGSLPETWVATDGFHLEGSYEAA